MNDKIKVTDRADRLKYVCKVCKKEFDASKIVQHMTEEHTSPKDYMYETPCGCVFVDEHDAELHNAAQELICGLYGSDNGCAYRIDHVNTNQEFITYNGWIASTDGVTRVENRIDDILQIITRGLHEFSIVCAEGCERISCDDFLARCKNAMDATMNTLRESTKERYGSICAEESK